MSGPFAWFWRCLAFARAELGEAWCLASGRHAFVREGGVHVCSRCPVWFVEVDLFDGDGMRRERLYKRGAK